MKVIQQLTGLPPKLAEKAIITLNFEALYYYSQLLSVVNTNLHEYWNRNMTN